jgi:antitoxin component YwqK of YwqJK toxin-antitoxin module
MRLIKYYIVFICVFGACKKQVSKNTSLSTDIVIYNIFVDKKELKLNQLKGQWFYNKQPFNGYGISVYENDSLSEKTGFYNGKREGDDLKYFESGSIKRKAFYVNNKLQGKKLNYSKVGGLISESNYLDGKLTGIQKIWFVNGQLAKKRNLKEGKEEGLQQAWLENGVIYVNYEVKNGRIFGMKRANLCYQLKNEKIEDSKKI